MNNKNGNSPLRPSGFHTIVLGGLTVGVLDCLAAMTNAAIRGTPPDRVWQYVASSVVGPESFNGGAQTVALGLLFHFCVAFGVAIGYYIVARAVPAVLRHPFISGPLYGVFVYFFMAYGVVPLTLAQRGPFNWYGFIS